MLYIQNLLNDLGPFMVTLYASTLLIILGLQYRLFIYSTFKIKNFSIGLSVYLLIHSGLLFFTKGTYGESKIYEIAIILLIIMALNMPMLLVTLLLREIVNVIRKIRFTGALKSGYKKTSTKALTTLGKVLPLYFRRHDLQVNEIEQLKHLYKDSKNDSNIPLTIRVRYCKSLIEVGIPNITVPHIYDVNMDIMASQDDILKVAHGALNEAKLIVKLAPNACVFSCRKYGENLAKYLFGFHNLQGEDGEDLESFSTLLFLLKKHKVIEDQEVLSHFYHIKEVGNDAAHGHLCDAKTAADLVEDALYVEQWFRACYNLSS